MIELTPEQRQAIEQQNGEPVRVVDPATQVAYVLVRADVYERVAGTPAAEEAWQEVPPGIRRSQAALRRDLPSLLRDRKLFHQWAAYHGDERVGIGADAGALLRECLRRGFRDDEYYIGWIDPTELIDEEDIGPRRPELEDSAHLP